MTREDAAGWLQAYVDAWRSYDAEAIGDLFTETAQYLYHPWGEPLRGRAQIVTSWRDNQDEPGTWTAHYEPWAIDGNRVVAKGSSHYDEASGRRTYHNVFLCVFDETGRCSEFTEFYAKEQ